MKRTLVVCAALSAVFLINAPAYARGGGHGGGHSSHSGSMLAHEHHVSGYTTKNGTYVAPHYSTNPNSTKNDNYSTKGNINPHTGEMGTKPGDGQ